MKLRPYPVIGISLAVLLAGGWLIFSRYQVEIGVTPADSVPVIETAPSALPAALPDAAKGLPRSESLPDSQASPTPGGRQGSLRVSNRSEHPVRLALLFRTPQNLNLKAAKANAYEPPAHWDFAPGEGSGKGLLVSLPDRRLTLKKGDVLVAFAQDGSQKYWGPYVINETQTPLWNPETDAWELSLEN